IMRDFTIASIFLISAVTSTVYFEETFSSDEIGERWIQSKAMGSSGKFELSSGTDEISKNAPKGLMTTEDEKLYAISSQFDNRFDNTDKDFIVQFSVRFEQGEECADGKIKILDDIDQLKFAKSTKFNLSFGPNICAGYRNLEAALTYDGIVHRMSNQFDIPEDSYSHQYTFIIKSKGKIRILMDNKVLANGSISTYFPTIKSNRAFSLENRKAGKFSSNYVGFEVWQEKAGTIFDDILVTDDKKYAKAFSEQYFVPRQAAERNEA
ncbi:concanavalin A-like lectin/glucanase, partial [Conidiobolus coronatus NRRL 28638]